MILNLFYERFRYVHDLFEPVQALVPTGTTRRPARSVSPAVASNSLGWRWTRL